MLAWFAMDWRSMFALDTPILEIFLRGSLVYLALFILLRVVLKRQAGTVSITDLLLIVLIADASQNAMASEYRSITSGVILVSTLVFWDYALDWLAFHFPRFRALVHSKPLLLVRDGRIIEAHLAKELLTKEQLESKLREHGIDDLREVRKAYMEGEGRISVIKKNPDSEPDAEDEPQPG
jgi:uncharacterized membrane protein YcaP (DUF421 family)